MATTEPVVAEAPKQDDDGDRAGGGMGVMPGIDFQALVSATPAYEARALCRASLFAVAGRRNPVNLFSAPGTSFAPGRQEYKKAKE